MKWIIIKLKGNNSKNGKLEIFLDLSQKANCNPSQQACTRSKIQKPKQENTKAYKKT